MSKLCDCSRELDYCDAPDVHLSQVRKARKEHKCVECGHTIQSGQFYEQVTAKYDGGWSTFKTCLACLAIRKRCCPGGWFYGELYETIYECLEYDYTKLPDYGYDFALVELGLAVIDPQEDRDERDHEG